MNLVNGEIIDGDACDAVLEHLGERIADTLKKPPLDIDAVIEACDATVRDPGAFGLADRLAVLGVGPGLAAMYRKQIEETLNAEAIRKRMRIELGERYDAPRTLTYASGATAVQTVAPLGVLFHITAGNVDGLPFISLLDGLLTGNVNIVKLPKEEGGLTVALLEELFKRAPSLREYVYVFDYGSKDIHAMKKLADVADAVVVWGGDEAVGAVRRMVDPNTRIIEWGHKISFAYVTGAGVEKAALEKLARHICLTNQLFCNSCQGVFVDTDDMQDVYDFCKVFLQVPERACEENPLAADNASELFIRAGITLQNYHRRIENGKADRHFSGAGDCGIRACADSRLETSVMYRNLWVKPLIPISN